MAVRGMSHDMVWKDQSIQETIEDIFNATYAIISIITIIKIIQCDILLTYKTYTLVNLFLVTSV